MSFLLWCWALAPGCLRIPPESTDAPGANAEAPTTAAEVLDRYTRALGGEEALRAHPQRTVEARLVLRAEPNCEPGDESCLSEDQSGSFLHQSTLEGRLYQRTVLGDNVEEHGFDGKLGWSLLGNEALRLDTPEEAEISREEGLLHWHLDASKRGVELQLLPPRAEDSRGRVMTLDGVRWRSPGAPMAKELWFARDTGLLHEEVSKDEQGDLPQSQIVTYEDYKKVDGVVVAHSITVRNQLGDRIQEVEFITQRVHHEPIADDRFAIPVLPDVQPKPDPLLAQLETARSEAREEPKDVAAQVEWARTAFMAAHFDEARTAATGALALDPNEPEALLTLTRLHLLRGELAQAEKLLKRARKTGVREQVLAREESWILHRKRDFVRLADALDEANSTTLAGRYRTFAGTPLVATWPSDACAMDVDMTMHETLALVPIQAGDIATHAIFDTGAADLIISASLADELEVAIQSRTKIAEGLPDIGHGQIPRLQIGHLQIKNVPVNVFDDASIEQMAGASKTRVRAVFGASLLRDYVVRVDVPGKKLRAVSTARKCKAQAEALRTGPSAPMYLHETHYLYIPARMNEAEGIYLLNTGMRGADLTANRPANDYAGIRMPPLRSGETPMVDVRRIQLADGVEVQGAREAYGLFQQTQSSDGFRVDGMFGLGILGRRPFVLDFEQLRLHFPPT